VRIVLDTSILVRAHESSQGLARQLLLDIGFLREKSELVTPNPILSVPIRDVNDIVVVQTAVIGGADVICTKDEDFYDPVIADFLRRLGVSVMDDVALMRRLRS
jgi:predicted nucleic acid-binding protein